MKPRKLTVLTAIVLSFGLMIISLIDLIKRGGPKTPHMILGVIILGLLLASILDIVLELD